MPEDPKARLTARPVSASKASAISVSAKRRSAAAAMVGASAAAGVAKPEPAPKAATANARKTRRVMTANDILTPIEMTGNIERYVIMETSRNQSEDGSVPDGLARCLRRSAIPASMTRPASVSIWR